MMPSVPQTLSPALEQKIKELTKAGMVFGEPVHEGKYTIIAASRIEAHADRVEARPATVIVIGEKGYKVHTVRNPWQRASVLIGVASIVFWTAMILHPPWKPGVSLLTQVKELIQTIRQSE